MAISSTECAELWGITPEHFLVTIAYEPTFPVRITRKPATWKAGEVIEWRDQNRGGNRPARFRRKRTDETKN